MENLPRPTPRRLATQLVLVTLACVMVYFALQSYSEWTRYKIANRQLQLQERRMGKTVRKFNNYEKLVKYSSFYTDNMPVPRWENVDETWLDLPTYQLVERLSSLYRPDRPFVLDSFSASTLEKKEGEQDIPAKQLTFQLKGYFLCLPK